MVIIRHKTYVNEEVVDHTYIQYSNVPHLAINKAELERL